MVRDVVTRAEEKRGKSSLAAQARNEQVRQPETGLHAIADAPATNGAFGGAVVGENTTFSQKEGILLPVFTHFQAQQAQFGHSQCIWGYVDRPKGSSASTFEFL